MSTVSTPANTKKIPASRLAQLAMPLMSQHQIEPTPQNYAIWYGYVSGENKGLTQAIDSIINSGKPFTPDVCVWLSKTYMPAQSGQGNMQAMEEANETARELLAQVMQVIRDISGETTQYNESLDSHTAALSDSLSKGDLREMVQDLMTKAQGVKQRGQDLNKRLEESRQEVETLKTNLEQISLESQLDFLTGVYNRKAFDQMMGDFSKGAKGFALLMVDIDHFKRFNDQFGHLLGDQVLKITSRIMKDTVKGKDKVARFGGEEFSVILPETGIEGAVAVAEAIRKNVAAHDLRRRDTGQNCGNIHVSIGAAIFDGKETVEDLIKRADAALYKAKQNGRNQVVKADQPAT